jgi:hypothetical protein
VNSNAKIRQRIRTPTPFLLENIERMMHGCDRQSQAIRVASRPAAQAARNAPGRNLPADGAPQPAAGAPAGKGGGAPVRAAHRLTTV